uniref:Vascular endothelial growth factor Aa n=1 Tax=Astyanax mexicanus TaxID=7994 RepID=A0A8B9RNJ2_ASTMX
MLVYIIKCEKLAKLANNLYSVFFQMLFFYSVTDFCNTREVLVDILQEYPDDIESTYIPSCVVLNRCAGCCNDEALECGPKETQTVTMEVLRVRQGFAQHKYQLNFTEHTKCECRWVALFIRCEPCSERRKRLFVQDPLTCTCSCKFTQLHCKSRQLELNERTCRFVLRTFLTKPNSFEILNLGYFLQ